MLPDLTIADLRTDIMAQLDHEIIPQDFVYVRGVGRHFTEVCIIMVLLKVAVPHFFYSCMLLTNGTLFSYPYLEECKRGR